MNGVQLAETLRQRRPLTKILFISGYTDTADVTGNLKVAGSEFLQKPLIPGALVNKIRQVLDLTKGVEHAPGYLDGMRILYADDDESNRLLVRNFLEPSRCTLGLRENGKLAFEALQAAAYDLVFMDLQMPVMDGLTAVRAIRAWEIESGRVRTPIIALTGMAGESEVRACLEAGFTSHLMKPIRKRALLDAVCVHAPKQANAPFEERSSVDAGKVIARIDKDLQDIAPGYLQSRRADVATMLRALADRQCEAIRILGHSMKGSGGGYGFNDISFIGEKLETAAKQEDHEELKIQISELSRYLDRVEVVYE